MESIKIESIKPRKSDQKPKNMSRAYDDAKNKDRTKDAKKVWKTTDEGFKIYTMDELQLGKGGDTELCPFDCDCCF